MPHRVIAWHQTPNPNARKADIDPPAAVAVRSFRSAQAARAEPLAERLFAVPGVAGLLFGDGWLTVSKTAEAQWKSIKPAVERVLAEAV